MLSDRPYMRDDYQRERTSFLVWLLSAMVAGFVIQLVSQRMEATGFARTTELSGAAIKHGYLWTLLTYPFLHQNLLHLVAVGLPLFFIGRELIGHVGERRLTWLGVAAAAGGGLVWFAVHSGSGSLIGATTILWCYFTVFACLFPNREMSFLVFFVVPVRLRPKYLAWSLLGFDVLGLVLTEVSTNRIAGYNVPHSAHLGAMLVGWLYYRYFHAPSWPLAPGRSDVEPPRWAKRPAKVAEAPAYQVNVGAPPSRGDLRAEVDRILDKINSHGFGALTAEEKRVLDDAKDSISRR
jgi:membrane associated rhomboid family serine protease